ncbi:fatty acyl-ACP thioesterase B [Marchantia polymorpha subsp. ruderalis]|uniref:Acyl-[acyl-carrier-protein] hydrolase n=2 Tax=Marchantia polymorpha TaxID=3197 RepID=A0A176VLY6_MARPO|nr:hypothetical protein AXG93_203s1100 [Marchantia polymorpha subsp. ruderalis]PTQ28294.1 hypothetical protein MARPO_0168s0018 [Marchantia polymorpha]BBN03648.1 hypothetical protein Mp_2g25150 [Marchantia polymorpha subsp. ruderalis]|eukprot:PTQ28294.1 hypothetical protein MARPO_0168s0018 [Marchantia polymorpha]
MEALRAASAALASTSTRSHHHHHHAGGQIDSISLQSPKSKRVGGPLALLHQHQQHDVCFFGKCRPKQQKLKARFQVRAVAARELVNLNGAASKVNGTKVEGASKLAGVKVEGAKGAALPPIHLEASPALNKVIAAMAAAILEMDKRKKEEEEKNVDTFGRGKLVENDFVYRQTFVIRSYEVGFDRTASIETLTNLFQETALNHVGMSDFVGDGMGTTHAMMRSRLIWVVTRMQIQVERYPVWGDVVEIDTWVAGEGKNGMRRDWLVTDYNTGEILARATSTWVTMNQDTRRMSKMPDDVRAEISPYFLDRWVMKDEPCRRIKKLSDDAPYIRSDLVPRLNDMDMNQHVNNVKYIGWVLESVPQSLSVAHELTSMILEYKRECSPSDIVQSMTSPDQQASPIAASSFRSEEATVKCPLLGNGALDGSPGAVSCSSGALKLATPAADSHSGPLNYTHLLRMQCDGAEIVRGRTVWRLKQRYVQ